MDDLKGFSEAESERIRTHLNRLVPHLAPDKFTIVGGIAIRIELSRLGKSLPSKEFNDLDLVAQDLSVVQKSIKKDFLIYHFHKSNGHFYIALVDPISKTKVDIFDSSDPVLSRKKVKIGENEIYINTLENQLTVLIPTILKASSEIKRDPKLIEEMNLIYEVCDKNEGQRLWEKRGGKSLIAESIEKVNQFYARNPQVFAKKPYHKPGPYKCPNCTYSEDFPLDSMEEIYKILGYIE